MPRPRFSDQFRKSLADSVKEGDTLQQAADRHGCSVAAVHRACKFYKVKLKDRIKLTTVLTFAILKDLLSGLPQKQIAEKNKVSEARVAQIKSAASQAGWQFLWEKSSA